jgi:uncharacterized protein involved in type VI secretion and phage assembly
VRRRLDDRGVKAWPTVEDAIQSQLRNIETQEGRSIAAWTELIRESGLGRHGEIVATLKSDHGMTHGSANRVALEAQAAMKAGAGGNGSTDADSVDPELKQRSRRAGRVPEGAASMTKEPNASPRYGKYRGIVTDNQDPERRGRIRVQVPDVLADLPSAWALPCVPYTDLGAGSAAVPPIGTGVWVEFEQGDADLPVWVGSWWNSGDMPPDAD